jgi:sulfite exporter TauE/SafE
MLNAISTGFVMGFGTSLVCLGTCVPILAPYTATGEKPSVLSGLFSASLFSVGRLIAYAGLLSVFIAVKETISISPTLLAAATMVSGAILMLSGLAVFGVFNMTSTIGRVLCRHMSGARSPLYLGILAGIKPCGPLLAAMAFMLTLPSIADMGVFILVFWLASSILLLAFGAVGGGLASILGRRIGIYRIRRIAGVAMVVIGLFLLARAIGLLMY